ncbi:MAG: DUF2628 domain-containing protein [Alphaproteobacteria bacterium]
MSDPSAVILVGDGFSWPAAALGPLWALGHGLWFAAAALAGLALGIGAVANLAGLAPGSATALQIGLALLIGWHAPDIRTQDLWRRGYRVDGLIVAPSLIEAECRYFGTRVGARP